MRKLILGMLLIFCTILVVPRVYAQPYFEVFPAEGNAHTDIFLKVRGLPGTGFYETYYLYLYWDSILLNVYPDNSRTYEHYFDIHFLPLNTENHSALGSHTVSFEVENAGGNALFNASFTFTITEYLPNAEYLALNATYYQLLANYTDLNDKYENLIAQYDVLSTAYSDLLNRYGNLTEIYTNYSELRNSFLALNSSYSELDVTYQNLTREQSKLLVNYYDLAGSYATLESVHDALARNYVNLQGNYTDLVASHGDLQTEHGSLLSENTNYRNLTYVLIAVAVVLLATTVYYARRKPK